MKKIVLFLSTLILISTLISCGGGSSVAPAPSVLAEAVDTPPAISVVTAN